MTDLDPAVAATISAAVERIVPSDDGLPGAREAGTAAYVLSEADRRGPSARAALASLAAELDTSTDLPFVALAPSEQDAILDALDAAGHATLADLVEATMEGFYGDPRHGGNRDAMSWRLIGFPGPTGGVGYRPPLGAYDAAEPTLPGLDGPG